MDVEGRLGVTTMSMVCAYINEVCSCGCVWCRLLPNNNKIQKKLITETSSPIRILAHPLRPFPSNLPHPQAHDRVRLRAGGVTGQPPRATADEKTHVF